MEVAKCNGPKENADDEYKRLYEKESGYEDNGRSSSDSDKCDVVCAEDGFSLVCGSDGVEYSSLCELEVAACKNPAANIVEEACFNRDV
ncbi:hypothetical protein DVH05_020391 [Phytophthora capsici]|nr:hypothetical protein DVH05_020391 [Phytophthora capsici]